MRDGAVAIVGMACRYPDARSPEELWENVLAGRQAFRRIPAERLRLDDYLSPERAAPDRTYSAEAALIEGYEFDRVRFRVAGSTFRSADLTHWLALDVAARALDDAGFIDGRGLPRATTGVCLGNTLTGEFSRANVMRLRWPYVRRVVDAALRGEEWTAARRREFLRSLEGIYKGPFPPVGEETLAGGLSNTIAGRICNHFDLKGGGYTVDGACASSLLAVSTACSALAAHDLDAVLAGGVDLSVDPFELVGFAKAGALAGDGMRVYDSRPDGFWPGEGCGFVVLMRHEDATAQGRRIYAVIRGWGVSSDGNGGLTRPEVEGQLLALQRAYRRAGFGVETVAYFEGHGTGTSVGDATELRALTRARREALPSAPPAVVGSVKANIGHTKAAAGVAGLIKATLALHHQLLPPNTGCESPHEELAGEAPALRVLRKAERWPAARHLRAAVSSMGFGGINAHVVVEAGDARRSGRTLAPRERALTSSAQDIELILMAATDRDDLRRQVEHLLTLAPRLSRAEVGDLAATMLANVSAGAAATVRAALVCRSPAHLTSRLEALKLWLAAGVKRRLDVAAGVFLDEGANPALRIGFLFPGQGSPARLSGGIWARRFDFLQDLFARHQDMAPGVEHPATEVAQPAIVTASLAGLRVLERFGVGASVAVGHSLGELSALRWGGALDDETLLRIAAARGKAMNSLSGPRGSMASINAGEREVKELLNGNRVVIAGLNAPAQTVISGESKAVATVIAQAQAVGLRAVPLRVSHAFHSPLVADAAPLLAKHLSGERLRPPERPVISTVTGAQLGRDADLTEILLRQISSPVRFAEAVGAAHRLAVDLWVEVGPGQVLSSLLAGFVDTPVISLDTGGPSLRGLWAAVGAAYSSGLAINYEALQAGRFTRPFALDWHPRFFANPCESAPTAENADESDAAAEPSRRDKAAVEAVSARSPLGATFPSPTEGTATPLELIRRLVSERAELPLSAVRDESKLLSDLHLNSITVGQLMAEAARQLGVSAPVSPTDYAMASVAELAEALERLGHAHAATPRDGGEERMPAGVDSWVRAFSVELVERPEPKRTEWSPTGGVWQVIAAAGDALAEDLRRALPVSAPGDGVVVCLPRATDEAHVSLLLEGARAALARGDASRFILVERQGSWGGASFARTLHLEAPRVTTAVVVIPSDGPESVDLVLGEIGGADGYTEAHYDDGGRRREPVLRPLVLREEPNRLPLDANDVLLVTGGAKGITAECALHLARETGARLALFGRSEPRPNSEVANNLERLAAANVAFRYLAVNVGDEEEVTDAVRRVAADLGPITGIIHAAAVNEPRLLGSLDESKARRTLQPKIQGARNLLAAVDPAALRLFITFGSVIARTGMPGEADYGLANEWLTRLLEEWGAEHPACRCLAIEWSVWSGVGMGARLGSLDALVRQGVVPITPEEGVSLFHRLLCQTGRKAPVSAVVMGRMPDMPTLKVERPELPFLRFLERPRVYFPGVELITDAELSLATDPYLEDHVFQGERLLPAVIGLEAMAQAVRALAGPTRRPVFEDLRFNRPVVVRPDGSTTIRLAALARGDGVVEVALRSEETAFQFDHFRGACLTGAGTVMCEERLPPARALLEDGGPVALEPGRDLYGELLFHRGRFRRVRGYQQLQAKKCLAEIAHDERMDWFSRYLPAELLLGDPGARDAAIHAIQACIPHETLLPVGIDRLQLARPSGGGPPRWVRAQERAREENVFVYDVEVLGAEGAVHERWEGLRLQTVGGGAATGPWPVPLLVPYVERRLEELLPGAGLRLTLEQVDSPAADRSAMSIAAVRRLLGESARLSWRHDGKPEVEGDLHVSISHARDLTLLVAGESEPLGCDIEQITQRSSQTWRELLGAERHTLAEVIARQTDDDESAAATRVWSAAECLKKVGASVVNSPLVLSTVTEGGGVLLRAGHMMVATLTVGVRGGEEGLALAVLTGGNHAGL